MSKPAMSSTPMSLKAFCTLSPHNPMSFDNRHDAAEQVRAELDHQRRRVDPLSTLLDVHAKGFENLLATEPVAHQVTGVDDKLFTIAPFCLGQRGVVVLQRDSAERN